jgi:hypothetical protein
MTVERTGTRSAAAVRQSWYVVQSIGWLARIAADTVTADWIVLLRSRLGECQLTQQFETAFWPRVAARTQE